MELESIRLRGFRNYFELDAAFVPGVNLILGDNAQGKTNLLEAMVYLPPPARPFAREKSRSSSASAPTLPIWRPDVLSKNRDKTLRAVLFHTRSRVAASI